MSDIIRDLEQKEIARLMADRNIPVFDAGDTLRVNVKIKEGERERIQAYEGVCIARKDDGINSCFTVRKISYGEGVERVFPLFSPRIDSIELVRRGNVRRAKLYYLRERRGKSARISERTSGYGLDEKGRAKKPKASDKSDPAPANAAPQKQVASA